MFCSAFTREGDLADCLDEFGCRAVFLDHELAVGNGHDRAASGECAGEHHTPSVLAYIDKSTGAGEGVLTGDFTLHGVTKSISFPVKMIGEGKDPWGGYRAGFEGKTTLKLSDYGIDYNLGPASTTVEIGLFIEGIRQ